MDTAAIYLLQRRAAGNKKSGKVLIFPYFTSRFQKNSCTILKDISE